MSNFKGWYNYKHNEKKDYIYNKDAGFRAFAWWRDE